MHHRSGDIPAGFGMVNGEAGKFQLIKISRMPCSNLGPDRIQDWCNMTGGCALKRQDGNASCSNLRARSGALLETSTSYKVQSLWPSSLVESSSIMFHRQLQLSGQPETGAGGILHRTMLQWRGFLRPDPVKQSRSLQIFLAVVGSELVQGGQVGLARSAEAEC